ncbi:MAG TPA: hypothetical protein VFS56_04440 [Gemmatimonadaceae bacterium]|nr:hypothetical protein [Gemmatimonadaceae bacterium]
MGAPDLVPLAAFVTAIVLAIGLPIARAFARRIDADSRGPRIPAEVLERLERMEQTLDAAAIEIERISEGQRFTTRLLSETTGRDARQLGTAESARDRVT